MIKSFYKQKEQIRKEILKKLKSQSEGLRLKKSKIIKQKLLASREFKKAKSVMFYVSKDYEVDTKDIIEEALKLGKKVYVPVVLVREHKMVASRIKDPQKDLVKGPYGIRQPRQSHTRPVPLHKIDLVVVPCLGVDKNYCRLGHGAGYYDRFLKDIPGDTPTIGLVFDFQILDTHLPRHSGDIPIKKFFSA